MSTLYLGADLDSLAEKLAAVQSAAAGDFFLPVTVAVPNPYMARWLRLWLARKLGVVVNFQFKRLETVMWDLLFEVDQRQHEAPVELLNGNSYRLMILSMLLDGEAGPSDLAPLREHLQAAGDDARRDVCRRAWQLAGRLGDLIRDYEYHRQQILIQKWLRGEDGYPNAPLAELRVERSQRALFQFITREPDGLRAILSRKSKKLLKSLPQYAHEVMELPEGVLAPPSERIIHVFGITQMSAMHLDVLRWLGGRYDLRLYYLNPLLSRLPPRRLEHGTSIRTEMQEVANRFREPDDERARKALIDEPLLAAWGRAGAESLWSIGDMLDGARPFTVESLARARTDQPSTVLSRLQNRLLDAAAANDERLPQDCSIQIVACPGVYREVETVYQSILHNLKEDSSLKQTDIAILVSDMAGYRPVLQSVFDRRPGLLRYNLADFSAAGLSTFGHGVLGLFDLALESFTRARVFAVLLNPCFLARLGVERDQALTWLEWAEELGIYHSWDAKDKQERGYANTPLYSWQLGLRRLRLGRLMDAGDELADAPAPVFQQVIPFADLASGDKEQLDAFCRAVEGLLPTLYRLRGLRLSGGAWARELRGLIASFLDVPEDRPGEAEVRDALFHTLAELHILDLLAQSSEREPKLPLSLMREFVADNLESVEGRRGDLLTGGVTISALRPLRPIPFRIIYILGLGEGMFPGSDVLSSFDLHSRERRPGDIRPGESNRFLLLEEFLAARDKIYLLFTCRDVQRDQVLHPCGPLNQVRRYLTQQITSGEFKITAVPLCANDAKYLADEQPAGTDVLVDYSETERMQALAALRQSGGLKLSARVAAELDRRLNGATPHFTLPANPDSVTPKVATVRLWELNNFLRSPAEAALKRHLRLGNEDEAEAADAEPFSTASPHDYRLAASALRDFVTRAMNTSVAEALQSWPARFAALYEQWRLRGRVPDGAFADVDRARFEQLLRAQIDGPGGLAEFVEARRHDECCGPVLLGESVIPVGARQRFPALKLVLPQDVRIVGTFPLAWRSAATFEILVLSSFSSGVSGKDVCKPLLEPFLFYLALKAGTETVNGLSSAQWLGNRKFSIHIAGKEGITTFVYTAEDISQEDARDYLTTLVGDFLNRTGFEMLPFDLIVHEKALKLAYTVADGAPGMEELRAGYHEQFADVFEQDQEKVDYATHRAGELVQVMDLLLPPDAFDKVRRRFRLIDRGPARLRSEGDAR